MNKTSFIGRQPELEKLHSLTKKNIACLIVIKGRRRIGKSRLVEEFGKQTKNYQHYYFTGLPPSTHISPQDEREDFAAQLARELHIPTPRADDWNTLLWTLAERIQNKKIIIIFDEINWMGNTDPTFLAKLKSAWDRDYSKIPGLIFILCGSLTSWIQRNILHSTGFLGRIHLDMTLKELPITDCVEFWGQRKKRLSNYELLRILTITGGIPLYLETIDPTQTSDENIRQLCFEPEGVLFREFELLFNDLFQTRNAIYRQIVKAIADKPLDLTGLYQTLSKEKSGKISEYIDELELCGFISRDYSWKLNNGEESKLSRIRLKDNYLRFYLKAIEPHKRKILRGGMKDLPNIDGLLGLQFENLILNNRDIIWQQLAINSDNIVNDNPFFQRPTKRMQGCQIDYLIQTQQQTLFLCEIKYTRKPLGPSIITEVEEKLKRLYKPRNSSVRPVLIHVNGVTDSVEDSDYFDKIIDFGYLSLQGK